jgi:hypothetical protein
MASSYRWNLRDQNVRGRKFCVKAGKLLCLQSAKASSEAGMRDNPRVESYHFRHGSLLNFYRSQHHNTAQIPFSKAS